MTSEELAILALADGTLFFGRSIGAAGSTGGEVVFNTAMTGYQEILSDPSYARQLITLTYPHIGNTGCTPEDDESRRPFAAGLIVRDCPMLHSNWRATETLPEYLERHGLCAIADIDTRKLTRILREGGAQGGAIVAGVEPSAELALDLAKSFPGMEGQDLAKEVTTSESYEWLEGSLELDTGAWYKSKAIRHIVAYDFGVKRNILRMFANRDCKLTVVPATTPASEVIVLQPDGIFLSNGPGDPEPCDYAIAAIRELIDSGIPMFGICLGHQLLALAVGARTVKMKFGHHGANHPVQDLKTGEVLITSQNHGFAADEKSLPKHVIATHRSLFDGSLQGIELSNAPVFGFQGHPEASPGPHDISGLFDRYIEMVDAGPDSGNVTVLREANYKRSK